MAQQIEVQVPSDENKDQITVKEVVEDCAKLLKKPPTTMFIRRKYIWQDNCQCRKKPWITPQKAVNVKFVGEPAVDGGGPTREFFTGMCIGKVP